ncbi:MAG: o-succinylbenzoate synthase [Proteobacteria bacterium]|nr:o-succinylbenzoate synthase [Pseudomonadota bacterium]
MKICSAQVFPICLRLRKTVSNAQADMTVREGTLLRLATDSDLVGWGEASPYPGFGLESMTVARSALCQAANALVGLEVGPGEDWAKLVRDATRRSATAHAGAETAMLDILARAEGVPLSEFLAPGSTSVRDSLSCNALVVGQDLQDLADSAQASWSQGFRTFKLKVGIFDLEVELARLACLRGIVGPNASIRLDANQAYEPQTALRALDGFAVHGIEYLEQPLAVDAIESMCGLREKSPILLAADESATTEAGAKRVIERGAADVIVIKPSAVGGPLAALRVASAATRAGLKVVVTSLLDSAIGVTAACETAAAIAEEIDLPACGLATAGLFERDVIETRPVIGGEWILGREPGLGIDLPLDDVRGLLSSPILEIAS